MSSSREQLNTKGTKNHRVNTKINANSQASALKIRLHLSSFRSHRSSPILHTSNVLYVSFRKLELQKLYPLQISRGTQTSSENLFVYVSDGKHVGIGELSPSTGSAWTADRG